MLCDVCCVLCVVCCVLYVVCCVASTYTELFVYFISIVRPIKWGSTKTIAPEDKVVALGDSIFYESVLRIIYCNLFEATKLSPPKTKFFVIANVF